jgi:hypothetical protein
MALKIETFNAVSGGNSCFKAIGHPLAAGKAAALLQRLGSAGRVAIYDPLGIAEAFDSLFPLSGVSLAHVFVQDLERVGRSVLGCAAEPVTALSDASVDLLFIPAFDAQRLVAHVRHLVPAGADLVTLDSLRLPESLLTDRANYLAPLNFATNFAFFRDTRGHHTRVTTANYWSGYGAAGPLLWLCLFDADGHILAEWTDPLPPPGGSVVLDSRDVRSRFDLPDFTGQLFIHVVGAAGHDVVKYALDTYGDTPEVLSCTHDANAWPADFYAGLPAPRADEQVMLWVQNSHPVPIPSGAVGLNPMGREEQVVWLDQEIPPFATRALDVATLLPSARWPQQIEIRAGKHFVRPRYEVLDRTSGRQRIAHPNVQRVDLKPDPKLPTLSAALGKGYILPAPLLPADRFRTLVLPTPMATSQRHLPLALLVFDGEGRELARRSLGNLPRDHEVAVDVADMLAGLSAAPETGHVELVYDFSAGSEADGWLHALFRLEDRLSGHYAETSFGAHVFNTVVTYRGEPQSYIGRPPGLSTRLFLRLAGDIAEGTVDSFCHLIYPASTPWHARSETALTLTRADGAPVASRTVRIACGGSFHFRASTLFDAAEQRAAGTHPYVLVRDTTCRLFGYHGLIRDGRDGAFSLDHMFGF